MIYPRKSNLSPQSVRRVASLFATIPKAEVSLTFMRLLGSLFYYDTLTTSFLPSFLPSHDLIELSFLIFMNSPGHVHLAGGRPVVRFNRTSHVFLRPQCLAAQYFQTVSPRRTCAGQGYRAGVRSNRIGMRFLRIIRVGTTVGGGGEDQHIYV